LYFTLDELYRNLYQHTYYHIKLVYYETTKKMKSCLGGTRHLFNIVEAGLGMTIPKFVPDRNQTPIVGMRHCYPNHWAKPTSSYIMKLHSKKDIVH
jgi:hypothetical protein